MRVLHISCTTRFGAGRALWRHHRALRDSGVDSRVLMADGAVRTGEGIHHWSELGEVPPVEIGAIDDNGEALVPEARHPNIGHFLRSRLLPESPLVLESDVLELRQLHAGRQRSFFDPEVLRELTRRKPVLWRLSDTTAFTGFCCYPYTCGGFLEDCENCPLLEDPHRTEMRIPPGVSPAERLDARRRLYQGLKLHVVGPSQWILDLAKRSVLGGVDGEFLRIPVGIDERIFRPERRMEGRARWGLDPEDSILVVNAPDPGNYRKGFDLLLDVLGRLKSRRNTRLLLIGEKAHPDLERQFPRWRTTGYLTEEDDLALAYAAGDVFLFPSRQDNSAQVLLEAAASSVPTVCFNVGGNAEYVAHGETGIVVPAFDTKAFAEGVEVLLGDPGKRRALGERARANVCEEFRQDLQTRRFRDLYENLAKR